MISIIIVSINSLSLSQLKKNIKETIGQLYEIIAIDNQENKYGLCEAYNLGAIKSKYENLCFIHEDILFHTKDWGKIIIELLENKEIGLAGVAGATYKSKIPAPWVSISVDYYRTNLIANSKSGFVKNVHNPDNYEYSEVIVLDGLFIATKKLNWQLIKFNEHELKGFHLYDIDISLRQFKKNIVSHKILIEHKSEGNFGIEWIKESLNYHKKHIKNSISINQLPKNEQKMLDLFAAQSLFKIMIKEKYNLCKTFFALCKTFKVCFVEKTNWRLLITFSIACISKILNTVRLVDKTQ